MKIRGIMAMTLVQDIDRAVRFYRDTLGLSVQEEQEDWVVFEEGIGLQVSPDPLPEVNFQINTVQISLVVEDVFGAYDSLTSKGVAFYLPPMESGGLIFAAFRDSENNVVQIMQLP